MSYQKQSAARGWDSTNGVMMSRQPVSMETVVQTLDTSELAAGLTREQLLRLADLAQVRSYGDGDLICDEYERGDELYVIEEGIVEAWIDPSSVGDHYGAL